MIQILKVFDPVFWLTAKKKIYKINFLFNLFQNLYGAIINMKLLKAHGELFLLHNLTFYLHLSNWEYKREGGVVYQELRDKASLWSS